MMRESGRGPGPSDSPDSRSSRILHPGVSVCDGFPECRFEATGRDLRDHRRHCAYSDTGALWRVFHSGAGL